MGLPPIAKAGSQLIALAAPRRRFTVAFVPAMCYQRRRYYAQRKASMPP